MEIDMVDIKKHSFKVGDDVSSGWNGDSRHIGKVARITKNFLFVDNGEKFSLSVEDIWQPVGDGSWADIPSEMFRNTHRKSWVLVKGIFNEYNLER